MSFPWTASERFGLTIAPGGAALIQDLLNTRAIAHHPDLLADPALAQSWATSAVRAWSATRGIGPHRAPILSAADLARLRTLRATLTHLLVKDVGDSPDSLSVPASFALSDTGEVRLQPTGTGWRWLASAVWGEVLLSQQADTWRRFKVCRNPGCQSTFYDRSKNNSGVWHDVKICGNAANLRASRARRRRSRDDAKHT